MALGGTACLVVWRLCDIFVTFQLVADVSLHIASCTTVVCFSLATRHVWLGMCAVTTRCPV